MSLNFPIYVTIINSGLLFLVLTQKRPNWGKSYIDSKTDSDNSWP